MLSFPEKHANEGDLRSEVSQSVETTAKTMLISDWSYGLWLYDYQRNFHHEDGDSTFLPYVSN
jgi:hypothetical protein